MGALDNKTILFSGVFEGHDRKDLEAQAEAAGAKLLSGVSKNLNYLVAGEKMGPQKKDKADELGVPIISLDDFLKMIGASDTAAPTPAPPAAPSVPVVIASFEVSSDVPPKAPYSLIPFRKGNKWGYATPDRRIVIDCVYDETDFIENEGPICLKKDGKSGAIDETGRVIIPFEYDKVQDGGEGMVAVKKDDKWGYFDSSGQPVTGFKYETAARFRDGLAPVMLKKKYGYINTKGEMVIAPQYSYVFEFSDGVAIVRPKKKYTLMDRQGNILLKEEYDSIRELTPKGYYCVTDSKNKAGLIDRNGNIIIPIEYNNWFEIDEMGWVLMTQGKKTGYLTLGKPVPESLKFPTKYKSIYPFSEGLSIVTSHNNRQGWVDRTGTELVPLVYLQVGNFHEGLSYFTDIQVGYQCSDGNGNKVPQDWGYVDRTGREVIMMDHHDAKPFSEGMASVSKNKQSGYIDKTGKKVIDLKYGYTEDFKNGYALVYIGDIDDYKNVVRFYIDKNGNEFYES